MNICIIRDIKDIVGVYKYLKKAQKVKEKLNKSVKGKKYYIEILEINEEAE